MLVQMLPDDLLTWPLLDVLVIVILSPSIMMIFIYISWRVRQRQRRQKDLAPQNVVTNLPVKVFRQVERKENEPEECAICLEDYVDGEELRILPCRHEFHVGCVDAWLTTRKKFVSPSASRVLPLL
jgi:E3 ubiquitin-protein ligase RNF13